MIDETDYENGSLYIPKIRHYKNLPHKLIVLLTTQLELSALKLYQVTL